jgi:hypothetical protein
MDFVGWTMLHSETYVAPVVSVLQCMMCDPCLCSYASRELHLVLPYEL